MSRGRGDGFETRAIHAGPGARSGTPARSFRRSRLATTFAQDAVGKHRGYEYSRSGNPTRTAMETCVASLEGARAWPRASRAASRPRTRSCARSIPATTSIIPNDAYGGTFRLVARVHERHGIAWTACDLRDLDALDAAWQPETAHGLDRDADEPAALDRRHRGGGRRSRTRARRGSSSTTRSRRRTCSNRSRSAPTRRCTRRRSTSAVTPTSSAGSSRSNDAEFADELRFLQNAMGAVPSPFDCYLVLRGVKTLALRMREHCANAQAIVRMLPRARRGRPGAVSRRVRGRAPPDARLRRHGVVPRARRGRRARARHRARACSRWPSRSARSSR